MRTVPLQHICDVQIGKTPSRSVPEYWRGELPWVTISDFATGRIVTTTKERITRIGAANSGSKRIPRGTLLLSFKLSLGKRAIAGCDLFTNEAIAALHILDNNAADRDYLYWALGSIDYDRLVDRAAKGKTLNKAKLKLLRIPLPPLAEQRRIAGILDAADALRSKRREALAQLDTLRQSTFLDMFGDPVTNPMGWEEPRLEDLCKKVVDCPHSTPRWTEFGVVCLRTSNLGKGEWNWADTRFVSEEDYTERTRRSEILPNDIILSREGTVGVLALVDDGTRLCMGQRLVQLRVNDSQLAPRFLLNLLLHSLAPERLSRLMAGSTSKHLNVKELRKLPVLFPPLEIQRRFAAIAESVEHQKASQRAHLAELDTLFASLQSRAFRGDL